MVYLFLADGFEEIEALTPVDVLRRAGVDIKTVSVSGDEYVSGNHGIFVKTDCKLCDVSIADMDMIVLPGGLPGADNLRLNEKVQAYIDECVKRGGYLAAICAAPRILGEKGLLEGKNATCYPGFEVYLKGAVCLDVGCVLDGKIITAKGMGKALEFSLKLVEVLCGQEQAKRIEKSIIA